jgi:hypothetical protein
VFTMRSRRGYNRLATYVAAGGAPLGCCTKHMDLCSSQSARHIPHSGVETA